MTDNINPITSGQPDQTPSVNAPNTAPLISAAVSATTFTSLAQTVSAVTASSSSSPFPNDPTETDPNFNTNFDPTNFQAMLAQLKNMMAWTSANDLNYNGIKEMYAFIVSAAQASGQLTPDQQAQLNSIMGTIVSPDGTTNMGKYIIEMLIGGVLENSGDKTLTAKTLQDMLGVLGPLNGKNPWVTELYNAAQDLQGNLNSWMASFFNSSGQLIYSLPDWLLVEEGRWSNFLNTADVKDWIQNYYKNQIAQLFKEFKDPFILFAMLMIMLSSQNDDMQTSLGGLGGIMNGLTNFGTQIGGAADIFRKGNFTGGNSKTFMDMLTKLQNLEDRGGYVSPDFKQLQSQIDGSCQYFWSLTVTDPEDKTKTISIQNLYARCSQKGDFTEMDTAFNSIGPNQIPPQGQSPNLDQWNQGIQALSGAATAVTNASQVTGQQVSQLQGTSQDDQAMIKAAIDSITTVEQAINTNMQQAGS